MNHNLREAMVSEFKGMNVGVDSVTVEVVGPYFGGYIKPAKHKENLRDRRPAKNQNGKRTVVVVARERCGRMRSIVFTSERAAQSFIAARVGKGSKLMTDEAP